MVLSMLPEKQRGSRTQHLAFLVDNAAAAVELRPKEFELLTTLARNPGVVFDRERLLKLAWGYDYYGDSRTVDVHVTWLREKLRESSARIQTVWGIGYKLVEAEPGEAAPARRRRA